MCKTEMSLGALPLHPGGRTAKQLLAPVRQALVKQQVQGGHAAGLQIREGEQETCLSLFYPLMAPITLPCTEKALKRIIGSYFTSVPKISA